MSHTPYTQDPYLLKNRFRGYLPVIIDIETGGFNASTDAILEIGVSTIEMDEKGFLYTKQSINYPVTPFLGSNLDPSALAFTGIDPFDEDRQALTEAEVIPKLFKLIKKEMKFAECKRAILVGHNVNFDFNFLNAAVSRIQEKNNPFHPFSTFDTVSLSALAYGQTVLAKSCLEAHIDFDHSRAHCAGYDAEKTAELFCTIFNTWQESGFWPPR
jgi:ribonuclease T